MTLKDAWAFIKYGIKEGAYDDSVPFEEMSDKEIIAFAAHEEARADAAYEASKEQEDYIDEPF